MPSRPVVVGIVLFWLAVLAAVAHRELLPRFFGDAPPTPEFVLVDELSQATVNWTIYRSKDDGSAEEKIGTATTATKYVKEDDSFLLSTGYRGLKLRGGALFDLNVAFATTTVRVTRGGQLLGQTATGQGEIDLGRLGGKLKASADVKGVMKGGVLEGTATLTAPELLAEPLSAPLDPTPVPPGQILNPLMPTDRLRGVVPGHKWAVRLVDPLRDAVVELLKKKLQEVTARDGKQGVALKLPPSPELLAEVLTPPEDLPRRGGPVSCWVIEYKSENPPVLARVWVRRDDGRVLRQEATYAGEKMRFEREE